jgi:hypothetical protein
MSDLIEVSQVFSQIEYGETPLAKVSQVFTQVEYGEIPLAKVTQVFVQVEYAEPEISGPLMAQLMRHGTWFGSGIKQKMWWAR